MNPADQFHPLDEVQAFGVTAHGLVRHDPSIGLRRFVDGVPWPTGRAQYFVSGDRVLQLVRKPGIGPVPFTEEQLTAERAAGRVWLNYALLLVTGPDRTILFGQDLGGWIYWASDGQPWSISPPSYGLNNATVGAPYALTFECRPFGRFGAPPAVTQTLTVTVDDVGQFSSPSLSRRVAFETINSTGSSVILALMQPTGGLPLGFLQLTVSDTDGVLSVALSVLKTEQEVLGTFERNWDPGESLFSLKNYMVVGELNPPRNEMSFPAGGGTFTFTASEIVSVETAGSAAVVGSATLVSERRNRVIRLAFDDTDTLFEYTCDVSYTCEMNYPEFAGNVSGGGSATATEDRRFEQVNWGMSVDVNMSRTASEVLTVEVRLYANNALIAATSAAEQASVTHEFSRNFGGMPVLAGDAQWYMGFYNFGYSRRALDPGSNALGEQRFNVSAPAPHAFQSTTYDGGRHDARSRLLLDAKMPRNPQDIDVSATIASFFTPPLSVSAIRAKGGVMLVRGQPDSSESVSVSYGIALAYPHVVASQSGPLAPNDHAYNPATRELVTDLTGGTPVTFI